MLSSALYYPHKYLSSILSFSLKQKQKAPKLIRVSKGQLECKQSLIQFFPNHTFKTVRPSFLRNPLTKRRLELDFYCPELKLAVEYNGPQHYHFTPYIHSTLEVFNAQCYRDKLKKDLCLKNNITLIVVPYTIAHIHTYLLDQLIIHGFLPSPSTTSSSTNSNTTPTTTTTTSNNNNNSLAPLSNVVSTISTISSSFCIII